METLISLQWGFGWLLRIAFSQRSLTVIAFFVFLLSLSDMPSPGRRYATLQRIEEEHLAAVHKARLHFAQERKSVSLPSPWKDFRAAIHVHAEDSEHTKGTRAEVLRAAKADGLSIIMFTDHHGPRHDTWSGMREGVLFFAGSEDDHQLRFPGPGGDMRFLSHLEDIPNATGEGFVGMEIYNRHTDEKDEKAFEDYLLTALNNATEWSKLARLQSQYPDEMFNAGADYWPTIFAIWDRELAMHPFTGIGANDSHKNQIFHGVIFDPYEVSFRSVVTHILARQLSERAIREALRSGRAYVVHEWLCDPSGFLFTAINSQGVFGMGDIVPMLSGTHLRAQVPVVADLRLIHNGAIVAESTGTEINFVPAGSGAYRLEAWLTVDDELRPWIYANAIYLQTPNHSAGLKR